MSSPSPRQPVFNIPAVLLVLLAVLLGIHAARELLPPLVDGEILARFAFVPGRTLAFDADAVVDRLAALDPGDPDTAQRMQAARFFLGDGSAQPWTVVTYAFLHGSWAHVGLNTVWLLAFGSPVARRSGAVRFSAFLLGGALAGALAHYLAFPADLQPMIGASAAVSACMAGALRFMFRPAQPVSFGQEVGRHAWQAPIVPIRVLLGDRRAVSFLVVWFATNLLFGIGAVGLNLSDAPVAWQAHVGGFLFGFLAFPWFAAAGREGEVASPAVAQTLAEGPASKDL